MKPSTSQTNAVDVVCPTCLAAEGRLCTGVALGRFHQSRINAAVAMTRATNKRLREEKR